MKDRALFILDNPEKNADLYYATGFRAPDPIVFFEFRGKKYLVASDLEFDRAKREARVDTVLSMSKYVGLAEKKLKGPGQADVIHEIFLERKIRHLVVPCTTSFELVDCLRKKGYVIEAGPNPFYPERFVKTPKELKYITDAQRTVFASIALARDVLKKSKIRGNRIIYKGRILTSDILRTIINVFLLERDLLASDTIVSCGLHAIDPHDVGSGPLTPHSSIIVDVFPRSIKTFYCGDATRTFCKGSASDALKKMYATVKEAQEMAISKLVKADINGRNIHEKIHEFFKNRGYVTGEKGGRRQGFFHGTGHSIGLEIHEEPARITYRDYTLRTGNVMSVEPGLYYKAIGGVRIEDLICVTKTGCKVISGFPKELEV